MRNKKTFFKVIILFAILAPLLYFGWRRIFLAPAIQLTAIKTVDLTNNPLPLTSYNKNLIISVWATWCGTCINEIPDLVTLKKQLNPSSWQIVLISDEDLTTINKFVHRKNFDLTFLKATNELSTLGIKRYPTTYIFDKNGELKFQRDGKLAFFRNEFDAVIEKM